MNLFESSFFLMVTVYCPLSFVMKELFPLNKRSQEAFVNYFKKEGLEALAQYQVHVYTEYYRGKCLYIIKSLMSYLILLKLDIQLTCTGHTTTSQCINIVL